MRLTRNLGAVVLGVWLILAGLVPLLGVRFPAYDVVMALLAVAAGILILVGPIKFRRSLGAILLAVWLILQGLLPLLSIHIPNGSLLLDLLAIAAGVLILLGS